MDDGTNCRTYGFDANTKFSSARGERFDKATTFGHTGWTGTMLWVDPVNDWLWMTPSTMMSGEFDLLMLVGERRTMFVPLPGCPLGTTVTPATFP